MSLPSVANHPQLAKALLANLDSMGISDYTARWTDDKQSMYFIKAKNKWMVDFRQNSLPQLANLFDPYQPGTPRFDTRKEAIEFVCSLQKGFNACSLKRAAMFQYHIRDTPLILQGSKKQWRVALHTDLNNKDFPHTEDYIQLNQDFIVYQHTVQKALTVCQTRVQALITWLDWALKNQTKFLQSQTWYTKNQACTKQI